MHEAPGRGEYVTYREHITAKEEAAKVMGAIQLEQAAQRAALMHLPEDVRRLTDAVNALGNRVSVPAPADSSSLALHHVADAMKALAAANAQRPNVAAEVLHALNTSKAGQPGRVVWAVVGGLLVIVALMGWRSLTGG